MNVRVKTVKGISWTLIHRLTYLITTFVVTAVLARLIPPSDFGLMAMVSVFSTFFFQINDLGLGSAVIYTDELSEEVLSSAFWFTLAQGVALSLALILASPLIANFFSEKELQPLIIVVSMDFNITSFGMIQAGLLSKEMNFKALALMYIFSTVLGGLAGIVVAILGGGAWSLVVQVMSSHSAFSLFVFVASPWKPKLIFRWNSVKSILGYGLPLTGFRILDYFSHNMDNLLIGRFLGTTPLGYYSLAYKGLLFPISNVTLVVGNVLFPSLSAIKHDKAKVRAGYIRSTKYIAAISFPLTIGLAVVAPQTVRVVFGPNWGTAVFLIEVFALTGGFLAIYATTEWLYKSQGRTGAFFWFGLISSSVFVTSFIVGLKWGVQGVAVSYSIAFMLIFLPSLAYPFSFIDLKLRNYLWELRSIFISVIVMGGIIYPLRRILEASAKLGDLAVLCACAVIGSIVYFTVLYLFDKNFVLGMKNLLLDLRS